MIVIDPAREFTEGWIAARMAERAAECPRHVWHRAPHDQDWFCVRCQVEGRIR